MQKIIATGTALLLGASSAAWGGATLHIGNGYGAACDTGGCPVYNNEVNPFSGQLDIYQNSGGASALIDPVLLILGVPNTTGAGQLSAGTLTRADVVDGSTGTSTPITFSFGTSSFGLDGNGYQGMMTSGDVYTMLGLTGANNSNSFTNWSQWDLAVNNVTASDFGIFIYGLHPGSTSLTDFAGQDFIDLAATGLPLGTFAVSYGMDASEKAYSTPFTEGGLSTTTRSVPEPASLALMGVGMIGLALGRRIPRKNADGAAPIG